MLDLTKIKKSVDVQECIKTLNQYTKEQIECTRHTFFRLNEKQRKIFTCFELKRILTKKKPFLVGIQNNNNYAVFFKYQNKNLKVILGISDRKIKIVTFYFIEEWQIPKI